jgi:hypothetical protein
MVQLAKHVHAEFQLSSFYTDELRFFEHFFKKFSEVFRRTLKQISKQSYSEYVVSCYNYQSMSMQNFNSLASTQTDIAKFLTIFQENFRIFQKILKRISEYAVLSLN